MVPEGVVSCWIQTCKLDPCKNTLSVFPSSQVEASRSVMAHGERMNGTRLASCCVGLRLTWLLCYPVTTIGAHTPITASGAGARVSSKASDSAAAHIRTPGVVVLRAAGKDQRPTALVVTNSKCLQFVTLPYGEWMWLLSQLLTPHHPHRCAMVGVCRRRRSVECERCVGRGVAPPCALGAGGRLHSSRM
jgi:hypothetical protein